MVRTSRERASATSNGKVPPSVLLDRRGSTPLYRQLASTLRRRLESGDYGAGARLPTENGLAATFGVSRHVVRHALANLVSEGRIVSRQGDGHYVNSLRLRRALPGLTGYTAAMRKLGVPTRMKVLRHELTSSPGDVVERICGKRSARVVLIERLAYVSDEPVALLADHFHPQYSRILRKADLEGAPLYEFLKNEAGIEGARAPTTLSVQFASDREAKLLQIREGTALIQLEIWTYSEEEILFSHSKALYRSDRFEFTLEKAAP